MFSPAKWWEMRGSANGEYNDFKLHHYNTDTDLGGFYYWLDAGNTFTLNKSKTLFAEINGYYHSPRQKDYKLWDRMSCVNVGIKALLLNKDLVIALNGDDIFAKAYWLQTNAQNGTREYTYDDERSVRLSITYKFGNKSIKGKRERSTTTDEMQRASQQ